MTEGIGLCVATVCPPPPPLSPARGGGRGLGDSDDDSSPPLDSLWDCPEVFPSPSNGHPQSPNLLRRREENNGTTSPSHPLTGPLLVLTPASSVLSTSSAAHGSWVFTDTTPDSLIFRALPPFSSLVLPRCSARWPVAADACHYARDFSPNASSIPSRPLLLSLNARPTSPFSSALSPPSSLPSLAFSPSPPPSPSSFPPLPPSPPSPNVFLRSSG